MFGIKALHRQIEKQNTEIQQWKKECCQLDLRLWLLLAHLGLEMQDGPIVAKKKLPAGQKPS